MKHFKLGNQRKLKEVLAKKYRLNRYYPIQNGFEDILTSLYSKNYFELNINNIADKMIEGQQENIKNDNTEQTWAILFCDIDGLKLANDTIGHIKADTGIKNIASIIKQCIRNNRTENDSLILPDRITDADNQNIPIRYGGDEFIIILPNCTKKKAVLIQDRIKHLISINKDKTKNMSLSIGIADTSEVKTPSNVGDDEYSTIFINKLIFLAEQRMYKDKNKDLKKLSYDDKKSFVLKHLNRIGSQIGLGIDNIESVDILINILSDFKQEVIEKNDRIK